MAAAMAGAMAVAGLRVRAGRAVAVVMGKAGLRMRD